MCSLFFRFGFVYLIIFALAHADNEIDFASVSSAKLSELLDATLRVDHGPEIRRQIVSNALLTKRLDLIEVCFSNPMTLQDTFDAIVKMPNDDLRQRATIMMLRTPSNLWPSERASFTNGIEHKVMIEPFVSVIPKLLPNVQLNENWLKYQVGRTRLADDMEAALKAKSVPSKTTKVDLEPTVETEASPTAADPPPLTAKTPERPDAAAKNPWVVIPLKTSASTPWNIIAASIAAAFALLWLFLKQRK